MLDALSVFENGFSSTKELNEFINIYLENTNHLKNPRYMGHQVAVPTIYREYQTGFMAL